MGNIIFRCTSSLRFRTTFIQYTNIDFAGYADDNTPCKYSANIGNVLDNLQGALEKCLIGC